jgi:hypothetical protein
MDAVPDIDVTALEEVAAFDADLRRRGVTLWLANLNARPLLGHGRPHRRPLQPPGPPEVVGEGLGVHVGQARTRTGWQRSG